MNNIQGYYLMPHPPIIIPDIGKGEEKKIELTSKSCDEIGKDISNLKPETIVIITPHSTMFSDAIAISNEHRIKGDLSKFRCSNIKMDIKIDTEFNNELIKLCTEFEVPVAPINSEFLVRFNRKYELDHGTIVPLYFINKYYNDYNLVHVTYSMIGDLNLYKFGMNLKKAAEALNRKVVIIASGDLSHKLKNHGPYIYSPFGEKFDNELLNNLKNGDFLDVFNMNKDLIEEAGECGFNSTIILLGSMDGKEVKGDLLSYEGTFGVGYGVMKFNINNDKESIFNFIIKSKEEKLKRKLNSSNSYVKLARESLIYYFKNNRKMTDLSNVPQELLNEKHGVFVSLKKFGNLRGCIGTILPTTDNVAQEIIRNSIEAAINDPRFMSVVEDELKDLDISVDVLMEATLCSKEELDPKKYGVIVTSGYKRGLLLPDLEGVDTIESQLSIACNKAGINEGEKYEIEKFEVIRYKEGE
ncbi:AmmeMemoRadiSam system protein A [Clostridium taeniosporum]|uniref:AMMECR1 domain-containing protein n=1 Tax=Clostridium taeniosporum TaxID=394958 RepID=A0A1D7XJ51_9CLOT|nr:AmmeMemoRadiSam system protein A [Clostridium taeniosporum]AOR23368.1 AMMECR1 domain-containing protein [Clostridium taeniosporum]